MTFAIDDARSRRPNRESTEPLSVGSNADGSIVVVSVALHDPTRSLTDAERAVAELATRGMSNAEIAIARGTSVRTVANQIASCLRKLGVASRTALAAVITPRDR